MAANSDRPECPPWLYWLETCPSTNTWALEHRQQLSHGNVVFTPQQTAGRGQQGRSWLAPTGVLTTSIVLDLPPAHLTGLSLVAGWAVINAIETLSPQLDGQLQLKWPNDILVNRRKLAGILCEANTHAAQPLTRVIVGIGLNRCADFTATALGDTAVSLQQLTPSVPSELDLLTQLRAWLINLTANRQAINSLAPILSQCRARDVLAGRALQFSPANSDTLLVGQGAGIGEQGELWMQDQQGQVSSFWAGRVVAFA